MPALHVSDEGPDLAGLVPRRQLDATLTLSRSGHCAQLDSRGFALCHSLRDADRKDLPRCQVHQICRNPHAALGSVGADPLVARRHLGRGENLYVDQPKPLSFEPHLWMQGGVLYNAHTQA